MMLKIKNGEVVNRGFDGYASPFYGTKYDVRIDGIKLSQAKQNEKLALEQKLKNLAYQKEQQIKREIAAADLRAKLKARKELARIANEQRLKQIKLAAQLYVDAAKQSKKAISQAMYPRDTVQKLVKNPLAGFGSGEGEVYYQGPSHKIKADFDILRIERAESFSNTEASGFQRNEKQRLNHYYVDSAVGKKPIPGAGAFPAQRPVKVVRVSGAHPLAAHSIYYYQQGMGNLLQVVGDMISRPFTEVAKFVTNIKLPTISLPEIKLPTLSEIGNFLARPVQEIGKELSKIDLQQIGKNIGNNIGHLLNSDLNPIKLAERTMKNTPLLKDIWREVDYFTGGTLTSMTKLNDLPSRALRGEGISKEDFIDAAAFALKAGLVVVSGGSAAALIGAGASQLKKGPLGQTELGRFLLSAGEIYSISTLANKAIKDVIVDKGTDLAKQKVIEEAGKKSGAVGSIIASAAIGKVENPGSAFVNNVVSQSVDYAKKEAAAEIVKKTGVPVTLATQMIDGKVPTQDQVQAEIVNSVKLKAATEFENKTGIPITVAEKIAKGEIPSKKEIEEKIYTNLRHPPEILKQQLANVENQLKTAPASVQAVLVEKQKVLTETINNREALVGTLKTENSQKLDDARKKVEDKIFEADRLRLTQKELKDKAESLLAQAATTANEKLRDELVKQANVMMEKLLAFNQPRLDAEQEAKEAIEEAALLQEELSIKQATIEYGAQDPRRVQERSTGLAIGLAAAAGVGLLIASQS